MSEYDEFSNDELREELKARNLPTGGNKEDLTARLEEDDANEDDQDDQDDQDDPTEEVDGEAAFIGVDPIYRNFASHTQAPLVAEGEAGEVEREAARREKERYEADLNRSATQPSVEDYPEGSDTDEGEPEQG